MSEAQEGLGTASASESAGRNARFVLLACCATHLVQDGLVAALYPLLPTIAADLQLGYAAAGSLRTVMLGSTSLLQLPAGYLAERVPETILLGAGMFWISAGFLAMAAAAGFAALLLLTLLAGVGGSPQHPLATSVVSKAYESEGRGGAISSLNFSGDVGKVMLPALAGIVAIVYGWRGALLAMGALGIAVSLLYFLAVRGLQPAKRIRQSGGAEAKGWGIQRPLAFALLSIIAVIDNSTRVGVLTFLPFLMADKGLDAARVSFLLTLIFACGAAGKLGCGFLADRFGNVGVIVITEAITAIAALLVLPVDPLMLVPVLIAFGFVLNGTSSVLYSSVAEMVHVDRRARTYGLFYTFSTGAGALAPLPYGFLADGIGIPNTFIVIAAATLATLPLALAMRGRRVVE